MRRSYDNKNIQLPNGDSLIVGTYMGPDGELSVKLRLPTGGWSLTNMYRPSVTNEDKEDGKTIVVLDKP